MIDTKVEIPKEGWAEEMMEYVVYGSEGKEGSFKKWIEEAKKKRT
jgi:hypothetical protein